MSASCFHERGSDGGDGTEKYERIVLGRRKAPSQPEACSVLIDGIDNKRAATDERCGGHTALQGVLDQACADPAAGPADVCRQLAEQEARNGIGRLAGADGSRQHAWNDRGRRKAVVADDPTCFVDH